MNPSSLLTPQHPFLLPPLSSFPGQPALPSIIQYPPSSGGRLIVTSGLTLKRSHCPIKLGEDTFPVQDGTGEVDRFQATLKTQPVRSPLPTSPRLGLEE